MTFQYQINKYYYEIHTKSTKSNKFNLPKISKVMSDIE